MAEYGDKSQTLSDFVAEAASMAMLAQIRSPPEDLQAAGRLLATDVFGPDHVGRFPFVVGIMALGIACKGHVLRFVLDRSVAELVRRTAIVSTGWRRPSLLQSGSWVIEPELIGEGFDASQPSNPIVGFGGAAAGPAEILVVFRKSPPHLYDGYATVVRDLEGQCVEMSETQVFTGEVNWKSEIARFAILFGALLDAKASSPLRAAVKEYQMSVPNGDPSPVVHEARLSLKSDSAVAAGELLWQDARWEYRVAGGRK